MHRDDDDDYVHEFDRPTHVDERLPPWITKTLLAGIAAGLVVFMGGHWIITAFLLLYVAVYWIGSLMD